MKKVLSIVLVMVLALSAFAGCGSKVTTITNSGSSALLPLTQVAVEKYADIDANVIIEASAGGSGTGLKQVADGSVDIGSSDVWAQEKLTKEQVSNLVNYNVCTITMMPIVNKDLGVKNVTTEELIDIFTGKITNWSEVGGPDEKITLITRPESSGTRATFTKEALNGNQEIKGSIETDNSGELLQNVMSTKGAIGYVALSYTINDNAGKVQPLAIDGVEPTQANAYNGSWKVWTYEHMIVSKDAPKEAVKFIEYMMSDEFAPEIEKMGYGAFSKHTTTKDEPAIK